MKLRDYINIKDMTVQDFADLVGYDIRTIFKACAMKPVSKEVANAIKVYSNGEVELEVSPRGRPRRK